MNFDFIFDENKNPVLAEISYASGYFPDFSDGYGDKVA